MFPESIPTAAECLIDRKKCSSDQKDCSDSVHDKVDIAASVWKNLHVGAEYFRILEKKISRIHQTFQ
jgi:hypothetical protein